MHRQRDDAPAQARRVAQQLAGDRGAVRFNEYAAGPGGCRAGVARGGGHDAQVRRVIERRVQRAPLDQDLDRATHLLVERRVGEEVRQPLRDDHADPTDARRTRRFPPRAAVEIRGGADRDQLGRDLGPTLGIDLARIDEPLGRREHRGQIHPHLDPAVVVLAAQIERPVVEGEVADAGREREAEQLGQLRADLPGVGVDGVPAREHQVERALAPDDGVRAR